MSLLEIKKYNSLLIIFFSFLFLISYIFKLDNKLILNISFASNLIFSLIFFYYIKLNIFNIFIILNSIYLFLGHSTLNYFYYDRMIDSYSYEIVLLLDFLSNNLFVILFIFFLKKENISNINSDINKKLYIFSIFVMILIGYVLFFIFIKNFNFFEFYGFRRLDRAKEVIKFQKENINIPYNYIFFFSFALLNNIFLQNKLTKKNYFYFILLLTPYLFSLLLEGDRTDLIYFFLPSIFLYLFYNQKNKVSFLSKIIPFIILLIITGLYRGPISKFITSNDTEYFKYRTFQIYENKINIIPAEFSAIIFSKILSINLNPDYSESISTSFVSFLPDNIVNKKSGSKILEENIKKLKRDKSKYESSGFNYYIEWYHLLGTWGVCLITAFVSIILNLYNRVLYSKSSSLYIHTFLSCIIVHVFTINRSNLQGIINSIFLFLIVFFVYIAVTKTINILLTRYRLQK